MGKGEFDRDMGDYLRARRRPSIKDLIERVFPKKKKDVEMPEAVEVYHEGDKPQEKKFSFFKKGEPSEEIIARAEMRVEDTLTDMKETARIALSAVKQLPDEQLRNFKRSPEFERLKEILKKHDLIK